MKTAYVVGSGPNGLTAAILLARAGLPVVVLEAQPTLGGGTRTAELTLPGFHHDVCSAVHPLAIGSPIFAGFPLARHGLHWIHPPAPLAHPFDDGTAALLERSVDATSQRLGPDGRPWRRIFGHLSNHWTMLAEDLLAPPHLPRHPLTFARFGLLAPWPAALLARMAFRTTAARALFAGCAAHSTLRLTSPLSAAFGLTLAIAGHAAGWPIPRGGAQSISNALASYFTSLGGTILTNTPVRSIDELHNPGPILLDLTPRQVLRIAGHRLPAPYCRSLEQFRYGPGVFKLDWALQAPISWRAPECAQAATVHLGGTLEEITAAEASLHHPRPFVLLAQPSLFDTTRAPAGHHTAWAYCHVPNGSTEDRTEAIESQIERFAPGFRQTILARHAANTAQMEQHNTNLVGGDINGGVLDLAQFLTRPTTSYYRTPLPNLFLCSASTPPGGGVHGMCGYQAARAALAAGIH